VSTVRPNWAILPGTVSVVPDADPTTRVARHCETHPRRHAEYACDSCGRPLCLTCAIPVRGRVLGTECIWVPGKAEADGAGQQPVGRAPFVIAGVAFLVALAGTVLPWSAPNFSHYTGPFGGWGFSPVAWSLVAAVGAASGMVAWAAAARAGSPGPRLIWALPAAGAVAMAGAILFVIWPPFATHPWLGPWVTLAGAAVAFVASVRRARTVLDSDETPGS
jgi:hypothetical protein